MEKKRYWDTDWLVESEKKVLNIPAIWQENIFKEKYITSGVAS